MFLIMFLAKLMGIKMFNGKTLLITGGTGSFGNAALNRLGNIKFRDTLIFNCDEKTRCS